MSQFTVSLPCKPYVRRFLEINFGDPVDLSSDQLLKAFFRRCLKKPNAYFENNYDLTMKYSKVIDVIISEDDFYRYGWELTKTDTVAFGREIEGRVKLLMRNMVGMNLALTGSIKMSIARFQDRYDYQEDVWPLDSIKKDFYRNGQHEEIDFNDEIFVKIERLIMLNLSKIGTTSKQALQYYENKHQTAG